MQPFYRSLVGVAALAVLSACFWYLLPGKETQPTLQPAMAEPQLPVGASKEAAAEAPAKGSGSLASLGFAEKSAGPVEGKVFLTRQDKPGSAARSLELVDGVPVALDNGVWRPLSPAPRIEEGKLRSEPPMLSALTALINQPLPAPETRPAFRTFEELTAHLRNHLPSAPVKGLAFPAIRLTQLPGAPRGYRNGVHEGIDFFYLNPKNKKNNKNNEDKPAESESSAIRRITYGEPVMASGTCTVVRADHEYREATPAEWKKLIARSSAAPTTPAVILDRLRGRTVWLQCGGGLQLRYAHLSAIAEHLRVGDRVEPGMVIGKAGNSGTREGVAKSTTDGIHLHLDILLQGKPIWEAPLSSKPKIREMLQRLWAPAG